MTAASVVDVHLQQLRDQLAALGPVVVAFSGGADSAFLAFAAHQVLGSCGAMAVTAVSASLAPTELEDCRALAAEWGLNYREVETSETAKPAYIANGGDRCWHCKDELMRCVAPVAAAFSQASPKAGSRPDGSPHARVLLGVNLDDLGEYRPGQAAAQAAGAVFPLVEAGFTKTMVREASRLLGLRTWDKPAAACLASRVPYGTPVSLGTLSAVAKAEAGLRSLGFRSLRVRHYVDTARVELPLSDLGRALDEREDLVRAVRAAGYRYVTLDLEGLRSGNLNAALGDPGTTRQEVAK